MLLDSDMSHFKNSTVLKALKISAHLPNLLTLYTISFYNDWYKAVCIYQPMGSSLYEEYLQLFYISHNSS